MYINYVPNLLIVSLTIDLQIHVNGIRSYEGYEIANRAARTKTQAFTLSPSPA